MDRLEFKKDTKTIVLHRGSSLRIKDVVILGESQGENFHPSSQSWDPKTEHATYKFSDVFHKETRWSLRLTFEDDLTDDMSGYYYSTESSNNKEYRYSLTHFQVSRSALPAVIMR